MAGRLEGKIAFITGAGSVGPGWGNGRATAIRFAQEGAKVFATDIDLTNLDETLKLAGEAAQNITTSKMDIFQASAIEESIQACIQKFGAIDILVNVVGGSAKGGPVEMTEEVWDAQVDFNLKSVFLTCKYALPEMIKREQGSIINFASTSTPICPENEY
jgi:NAD(P)-dependent dehydrogenase (short-subunit alcohol dehydrogenase family)